MGGEHKQHKEKAVGNLEERSVDFLRGIESRIGQYDRGGKFKLNSFQTKGWFTEIGPCSTGDGAKGKTASTMRFQKEKTIDGGARSGGKGGL